MRTCDHCGDEIVDTTGPGGRSRPSKHGGKFWCRNKRPCMNARSRYATSLKPKVPAPLKGSCTRCKDPIKSVRERAFCTKVECRRQRDRERMKVYAAKKLAEDGVSIYAKYWNSEANVAHRARRRAQKYGPDAENINPREIFDRDGWLCGLCLMPVDPELKWPHVLAASLDHVVPLSLGGSHTHANVQCSHLTCNTSKGNRADTMGRSPSK